MPVRPTSQKSTTPEDYRILDLEPGATREDAKRAYRRLAKQWHPDRFHNFPEYERIEAENRFKRITEAYVRIQKEMPEERVSVRSGAWSAEASGGTPSASEAARGQRSKEASSTRPSRRRSASPFGRAMERGWKALASASGHPWAGALAALALLTLLTGPWTQTPDTLVPGRNTTPSGGVPGSAPSLPLEGPHAQTLETMRPPHEPVRTPGRPSGLEDVALPSPSRRQPSSTGAVRRDAFSLGSSEKQVLAVQGPPDKVQGNVWLYGLSDIRFRDGVVIGYNNFDGRLKVVLSASAASPDVEEASFFSPGATRDEVLRVQGTPTRVEGNHWFYGFSEVHFVDGRVASFDNYFGNLKIRMLPASPPEAGENAFTIGSTKDQVLAVQGTPSSIRGNIWFYRFSDVLFRDGKVSWVNDPTGNLKFVPPETLTQKENPES
jgi:outer membrane protein assembly factor BamE (lipoprotein component of BamABCDE complex)